MAYIDGAYTTSATILKDLARVFSMANALKEPEKIETLKVQNDDGVMFIETSYPIDNGAVDGDPVALTVGFYELDGTTFLGNIVATIYHDNNTYKAVVVGAAVDDEYVVKYYADLDSKIIFPEKRTSDGQGGPTFAMKLEQIEDQLNRINENQRFIIKMTITKDKKPKTFDPFNEDPDHDIRQASIYIEFKKPKYVINHETMDYDSDRYDEDNVKESFTMKNNHHFFIRMIDKVDDITGKIDPNAVISNWSKMSWSLDYKEELRIEPLEVMIPDDEGYADGDAELQAVEEVKSRLVACELPKFCDAENMFIQFYCHCDNDKINLVVKGNDDVALNDYLLSYAYIGKIKSFINEDTGFSYANDIIGNFALTVGSSTVPLEYPRNLPPNEFDIDMGSVLVDVKAFNNSDLGLDGNTEGFESKLSIQETLLEGPPGGTTKFFNFEAPIVRINYRVSFVGDDFESMPSNVLSKTIYKYLYPTRDITRDVAVYIADVERIMDYNYRTNDTEYNMTPKLKIKIPSEVSGLVKKVKIYKSIVDTWENDDPKFLPSSVLSLDNRAFNEKLPLEAPDKADDKFDKFYLLNEYTIQPGDVVNEIFTYTDIKGHEIMLENDNFITAERFVIRFGEEQAIKNVKFSNRFGIDSTATGVNDILMFKTRIGSYFQKHFPAFMTPDEFLNKHGFNVSRWTDRVHITPVYVVHPGDGYRGELIDVLFLTQTNMKNGDILIINEGKENEEKYKFFKVNAPFSCLNASPDYTSGVAIRYKKYE